MTDKWKHTVWMYILIEDTLKITEITWFGMCYSLYISIDVQEDNTVDKGLISAPFALLSLRVRPVRRLVDSNRRNFRDLQGRRLRRTGRTPIEDNTVNHGNYTVWSVLPLVHRC